MTPLTCVLRKLWLALIVLGLPAARAETENVKALPVVAEFPAITNLAQLHRVAALPEGEVCSYDLEGTVLAASPGLLFLQDATAAEALHVDLNMDSVRVGQQVRLRGTNYLSLTEVGTSLGSAPLVENDGLHGEIECTGTVRLRAGRYPVHLAWFNFRSQAALDVRYSGPGFGRRGIPDAALLHREGEGGTNFAAGLRYDCYEGQWLNVPRFESLRPARSGIVPNFGLEVKTRRENVGLRFEGYLQVNAEGLYTFYLRSDDGSRLFISRSPTECKEIGPGTLQPPRQIACGQPLQGSPAPFWAEMEGTVSFVGRQQGAAGVELTSGGARVRVTVCRAPGEPPGYLRGSRVRLTGICLAGKDGAGDLFAACLVSPDWRSLQVLDVPAEVWSGIRPSKVGGIESFADSDLGCSVRLSGKLLRGHAGEAVRFQDETGSVPIELLDPDSPLPEGEIECLGRWAGSNAGPRLTEVIWRESPKSSAKSTDEKGLLTTAAQVQQLKREHLQQGYRARIRGVVTWVAKNRDCAVVQDATRGVFVGLRSAWTWDAPRVGEIVEVEGACKAAEFSPIIILSRARKLGLGQLPTPMQPTWDQLIGGSLDSQYVEIRGFVTKAGEDHLTLLMAGGPVEVEFRPAPADGAERLVRSVVRIRGCMFAKWDHTTRQVTVDHPLWFGNSIICVEDPAPRDPFWADPMPARELMRYDVKRNLFRRVKVSGQVLAVRKGTCYLTDHGFGMRFHLAEPEGIEPGTDVEVVGLPELGGPSPLLREAVARKTGYSALPPPQPLVLEPGMATADATRVSVEATLVESRASESQQVLEMQIGLKRFAARLPGGARDQGFWPPGSLLKLTGVLAELGPAAQEGAGIGSFEILVDSPRDIELVARPPWWTLNRLLAITGFLGVGLTLAFVWINLLRRQVERRTLQLQQEIGERQRAERDRAIEQERSRIARDLHDDLGSRLTAINMLAMPNPGAALDLQASHERLHLISNRARTMVTTLDGLVWTVNPKNDTLAAMAEYLGSFAEELLAMTDIRCQVDIPSAFPPCTIPAQVRHNVLLAVREGLSNAVRHGRPHEVGLRLSISNAGLTVEIRDDGVGFDPARVKEGNGLGNLQERMRRIGGACGIQSAPGNGTTITLSLPLCLPAS